MMAIKMMKEREGWLDDAPSAMPSAAACMTRPRVVEKAALGTADVDGEGGTAEDKSDKE